MNETVCNGLFNSGRPLRPGAIAMFGGANCVRITGRIRMRPLVSSGEAFGCTLATSPHLVRSSTAMLMDVRVQVPADKCAASTGSAGSMGAVLVSGSL